MLVRNLFKQSLYIHKIIIILTRMFFVVPGVLGDVKTEFEIGDDKAGLLQTVFVIAYMIFAPIFGYLGDRYSRRSIMAFGVALWCITTFVGSFITVSICIFKAKFDT